VASTVAVVIAVSTLRMFDDNSDYDNDHDNEGPGLGTSAAMQQAVDDARIAAVGRHPAKDPALTGFTSRSGNDPKKSPAGSRAVNVSLERETRRTLQDAGPAEAAGPDVRRIDASWRRGCHCSQTISVGCHTI
jgi:hypothetical protein